MPIRISAYWVTRSALLMTIPNGHCRSLTKSRIPRNDFDVTVCPYLISMGNRPNSPSSIRSIPYTPLSHPFVERLIGTIRREYLDRVFFWNAQDLERKLDAFLQYYNHVRVHQSLDGNAPGEVSDMHQSPVAKLGNYSWISHCNGLFQTPIAA